MFDPIEETLVDGTVETPAVEETVEAAPEVADTEEVEDTEEESEE